MSEVRKFLVAQEYHAPHPMAPYFCGCQVCGAHRFAPLFQFGTLELVQVVADEISGAMPATPWTSATFLVFRASAALCASSRRSSFCSRRVWPALRRRARAKVCIRYRFDA